MGHANNKIFEETLNELNQMQAFGTSKHKDKKNNDTQNKIYSYSTYKTYKSKCMDFIKVARYQYKCKSLEEAKQYIPIFLQDKLNKGYSIWTIKLYASSLAKLYHVPSSSFIDIPTRNRSNIKRSRCNAIRDRHFSKTRNATLIDFCKSTGLRRRELEALKGNALFYRDGQYYLHIVNGKGGKERDVLILNNNPNVINRMKSTPPNQRVWGKVHSCADIHSYRSDYANTIYSMYARPLSQIPKNERYYARKDMKGCVYDTKAMQICSTYMGHNRICVISYSYLRKENP